MRFIPEVLLKKATLALTFVDIALIKNNARLGSSIAVELCKIRKLKETNAVVSINSVDCYCCMKEMLCYVQLIVLICYCCVITFIQVALFWGRLVFVGFSRSYRPARRCNTSILSEFNKGPSPN